MRRLLTVLRHPVRSAIDAILGWYDRCYRRRPAPQQKGARVTVYEVFQPDPVSAPVVDVWRGRLGEARRHWDWLGRYGSIPQVLSYHPGAREIPAGRPTMGGLAESEVR